MPCCCLKNLEQLARHDREQLFYTSIVDCLLFSQRESTINRHIFVCMSSRISCNLLSLSLIYFFRVIVSLAKRFSNQIFFFGRKPRTKTNKLILILDINYIFPHCVISTWGERDRKKERTKGKKAYL